MVDQHGTPPKIATVGEMACLILAQHIESITPPLIGQNWVCNFINRHDTIKSKYNCKYDYQCAKCKDPNLIHGWFQHVQSMIIQYGIHKSGIYNFNETSFQMGVILKAKVITVSDRAGQSNTTQPGNYKWVTVIETICV